MSTSSNLDSYYCRHRNIFLGCSLSSAGDSGVQGCVSVLGFVDSTKNTRHEICRLKRFIMQLTMLKSITLISVAKLVAARSSDESAWGHRF